MKIELELKGNQWLATYSGQGSEEIVELFGQDTIPTAFTHISSPNHVLNMIQKLNPTALVILAI